MMKLRWNKGTLDLLNLIHTCRAKGDQAAAKSFLFRVAEATGRLLTVPMSGRPGPTKGTWLLPIPGAPYVILYRVERETVDILSIMYTPDRAPIWNWGKGGVFDSGSWT